MENILPRREARENAFLLAFSQTFGDIPLAEALSNHAENDEEHPVDAFSRLLLNAYYDHSAEVDDEIRSHLRNWTMERLPRVSLTVLRLAVAEMLFGGENKPGVAINEAVELTKKYGKKVRCSIIEIKNPDTNATLVAENIAAQLEKRIGFRRAMKQCMGRAMRMGAKGIKVSCGGRLGGAEIARTEHYHEGTIPLQTLRADIDYGFAEAATTYGRIGVKVWIYKGEVLHGGPRLGRSIEAPKPAFERRERRGGRDDRRGGRRDFNRGERRAPRQEGGNR